MNINNETALITGASSGIGEVFARKLAERGYNLILVARRKEKLNKIAADLHGTYSINAEVLPADLSRPDEITRIAELIKQIDKLSMLINVNLPGWQFHCYCLYYLLCQRDRVLPCHLW